MSKRESKREIGSFSLTLNRQEIVIEEESS